LLVAYLRFIIFIDLYGRCNAFLIAKQIPHLSNETWMNLQSGELERRTPMKMTQLSIALLALVACANAFNVMPVARPVRSSRVQQPAMVLGSIKKLFQKKEDPAVTAARASLSSMQSLSSLSSMKLELEEDGKAGRVAGPWKEYVKNDGRKWYYNTETSKMTWTKPQEFITLDKVTEAAAAANAARSGK